MPCAELEGMASDPNQFTVYEFVERIEKRTSMKYSGPHARRLLRSLGSSAKKVSETLIFRIVGVVAALNRVVRPKEIYNLRSSTPLWQEPGNEKGERRDAVPSWRCLYCLPTVRRQQSCSGWCGGTAGCFAPTAG